MTQRAGFLTSGTLRGRNIGTIQGANGAVPALDDGGRADGDAHLVTVGTVPAAGDGGSADRDAVHADLEPPHD
eukprot:3902729-Rhodomonas_salina.1